MVGQSVRGVQPGESWPESEDEDEVVGVIVGFGVLVVRTAAIVGARVAVARGLIGLPRLQASTDVRSDIMDRNQSRLRMIYPFSDQISRYSGRSRLTRYVCFAQSDTSPLNCNLKHRLCLRIYIGCDHRPEKREEQDMIKKDAAIMQDSYSSAEVNVAAERRLFLARKGQLLYGKYCGTQGRGICAESFAEYHIWRGEFVVACDFLTFLAVQAEMLRRSASSDTEIADQLHITEQLIERIETLLKAADPIPSGAW
jgi:hypothetical protein